MLRKLQNLAELEQRWDNEMKDIIGSGRAPGEGFFVNYHLAENKLSELEMLCFITGAKFEEEDPELSVKELITLVGQDKHKEEMSKVWAYSVFPHVWDLAATTGHQPAICWLVACPLLAVN
jgi:hypothetical protein